MNRSMLAVYISLLIYGVGFFLFYPSAITNNDESFYIRQAIAFSKGKKTIVKIDPYTGNKVASIPSRYSPGTSLLMAPFVAFFGYRGAFIIPFLAFIFAVLLMAKWLIFMRVSPLWSLLLIFYLPAMVLGRIGVSDIPNLFIIIACFYFLWRANERSLKYWSYAGLLAAVSLSFRETNAILLGLFFLVTILKNKKAFWPIMTGGLAGLIVFFALQFLVFGKFLNRSGELQLFSLSNVVTNLPMYGLALLVLMPAGIIAIIRFKGRYQLEIKIAVIGFLLFLLTWSSGVESGMLQKLILQAPRFFMAAVPLCIIVLPEFVQGIRSTASAHLKSTVLNRLHASVKIFFIALIFILGGSVHFIFWNWSKSQQQIIESIYHYTKSQALLVTDGLATRKFINEIYGERSMFDMEQDSCGIRGVINGALSRRQNVYIVLLERTDSEFWKKKCVLYNRMVKKISTEFILSVENEKPVGGMMTLHIWRVNKGLK